MGINPFFIVKQQNAFIIQRFGKYHKTAISGYGFKIPFIDLITYKHNLKQQAIDIQQQTAITKDNVSISIDGTLFLKIQDPYLASYQIEDPHKSIQVLAQTVMRSQIGKLRLDQLFQQREKLNQIIQKAVHNVSIGWGIKTLRYEILNIDPPEQIKKSMQLQSEAQRLKRRDILLSEGQMRSKINIEEGNKLSQILIAQGEAQCIRIKTQKEIIALEYLKQKMENKKVQKYILMNKYLEQYIKLIKNSDVVVLPESKTELGTMMFANLMMMNKMKKKQLQKLHLIQDKVLQLQSNIKKYQSENVSQKKENENQKKSVKDKQNIKSNKQQEETANTVPISTGQKKKEELAEEKQKSKFYQYPFLYSKL